MCEACQHAAIYTGIPNHLASPSAFKVFTQNWPYFKFYGFRTHMNTIKMLLIQIAYYSIMEYEYSKYTK